uniref:Uncharacterized protein n=1 Tax=Anguilla anguilla TaxID=7936 RepID=A0A0E9W5M6_ANGAN
MSVWTSLCAWERSHPGKGLKLGKRSKCLSLQNWSSLFFIIFLAVCNHDHAVAPIATSVVFLGERRQECAVFRSMWYQLPLLSSEVGLAQA